MVCCKCGLPKEICVCAEIEIERLGLQKPKKEERDDFLFCNQCDVYHYPGQHIKKQKRVKQG